MALVTIKPIVAFQQGDTFVFGSWVCVADGVGSFQRFLVPTPESKLKSSTLTQASMENLVENFGEISISDPFRDLESESEYNSTSPPIQTESLSPATQFALSLDCLPPPFLFGHHHVSAAY